MTKPWYPQTKPKKKKKKKTVGANSFEYTSLLNSIAH